MTARNDNKLYDALTELNLIKKKDLDNALEQAKKAKVDFGSFLVENDYISSENLGKLLSDSLGLPYVKLQSVSIPQEVLNIIPKDFAENYSIIPYKKDGEKVLIATSEPDNKEPIENVRKLCGGNIEISYSTQIEIKEALKLYKKNLESVYSELTTENTGGGIHKIISENQPVDKILETLIEYAYDSKASDIHIDPNEKTAIIRFRIDGVLHDTLTIPRNIHDQLINKIKVDSKLRTDEHLSAQDGKMQEKIKEEDLDIRVSIVPVIAGENAVLRLLSSKTKQYSLLDLGMTDTDLKIVEESIKKPYGMILSTGPTGSGKTTTMYSILKILNTREVHIATIEDPVEYSIQGLTQIQVNNKTNLNFANGLRSILRQDPNIIYVGEIRDKETADIAINSAMTGHLVLSTLHTNDAPTSLPRLTDMSVEPFLISSTINIIIAQRLVRKICESCKVSYTATREEILKAFGHKMDSKTSTLYKGKGCPVCNNTGYVSRVGIFEILKVNEEIRKLITLKSNSDEIREQAKKEGMTTMLEDGIQKALVGLTTIEEVLRVTRD